MKIKKNLLSLAVSLVLSTTTAIAGSQQDYQHGNDQNDTGIKHVLLISVDGLHQNDLDWFVKNNPGSTLAGLVANGVEYNNAQTPYPSDSFPGMVGQVTGGNPKTTGIYYDDEYSRVLFPQGTTNCKTAKLGAEVYYAEVIEPLINGNISLDGGQGIPNLYPIQTTLIPGDLSSVPSTILKMASSPDDLRNIEIDPSTLPVDPTNCTPVYPHQYVQVNTIFEVAKAHGLHTAWVDKHPAYEIMNGPSGYGIDDLFSPEINSVIDPVSNPGNDWTKDNTDTQRYDTIKVAAVVNQINGKDHSGVNNAGVPAIFGMNFQVVSTAEKLNKSTTPQNSSPNQLGGYNADGTPGPVMASALYFVDSSLKQMQDAINSNSETQSSTAIIVSAKHGQSPVKRSDLTLINDGNNTTVAAGGGLTDAANAAWAAAYPSAAQPLIAHPMDDDGVLWWLNDRVNGPAFAKNFLLNYNSGSVVNGITVAAGIGSDASGNPVSKNFTSAGLSQIYAGTAAAQLIGVNPMDARYPDVIGIAKTGSVYAGSKLSKIAEHGGGNINDRHVPIVVHGPGIKASKKPITSAVQTVQIAPTILQLLGLDTTELQAVNFEKTQVLPGLK